MPIILIRWPAGTIFCRSRMPTGFTTRANRRMPRPTIPSRQTSSASRRAFYRRIFLCSSFRCGGALRLRSSRDGWSACWPTVSLTSTGVDSRRGFSRDGAQLCRSRPAARRSDFRPEDVYGNIDQVLWPVRRLALEYMGYDVEEPFVSYAAPRVADAEREAYLRAWCERVVEAAGKPVTSVSINSEALIASTGPAAWSRS